VRRKGVFANQKKGKTRSRGILQRGLDFCKCREKKTWDVKSMAWKRVKTMCGQKHKPVLVPAPRARLGEGKDGTEERGV